MESDLKVDVLTVLREIQARRNAACSAVEVRKTELNMEWREMVKADRLMQERQEEFTKWNGVLIQSVENIFIPGTIIQVKPLPQIVVVDSASYPNISGWVVKETPSRGRKCDCYVNIDNVATILSLHDIKDKKLCNVAKKLIARVRLKDW